MTCCRSGRAAFIATAVLAMACVREAHAGDPNPGAMELVHVLIVGPGQTLTRPSQAARSARDGDVVEIEATTYSGDAAVWTQNNLIIRGKGGRAHLEADGASAEGKGIWVIKGQNTTVENIEFSGAKVGDENGAGIRQEGAGLLVRDCYFHDNEDGILAGRNPQSEILIEQSEFARNGAGDGQTHNLYVGEVKRLTLRQTYSHDAKIGHNLKSRARETHLLYNRFADEKNGSASYAIDLPNGGLAQIVGNVIQKGPDADSDTLVAYGKEGLRPGQVNQLLVRDNTFLNDQPEGGVFIYVAPGTARAEVIDNVLAGRGKPVVGAATMLGNTVVASPTSVDRLRPPRKNADQGSWPPVPR